jgi:3-hydroxybutyryl-CoA dehydrogenase
MTGASVKLRYFGPSASLPETQTWFAERGAATVLVLAGTGAGRALPQVEPSRWTCVLVELTTECLGLYHDEREGSNVLGFARFRLGDDATSLVEVVRQRGTSEAAVAAARDAFGGLDWEVAVCTDVSGRIVDRLLRPYLNDALTAVDEGLASAADLDLTIELGLSYPEGPIRLLERTGLADHALVSRALFDAYGEPSLVPARRARLALERTRLG